jgi:hypothetical protein
MSIPTSGILPPSADSVTLPSPVDVVRDRLADADSAVRIITSTIERYLKHKTTFFAPLGAQCFHLEDTRAFHELLDTIIFHSESLSTALNHPDIDLGSDDFNPLAVTRVLVATAQNDHLLKVQYMREHAGALLEYARAIAIRTWVTLRRNDVQLQGPPFTSA